MKIKKVEEQFKVEKETTEVSMKKQQEEFDNKIQELEERMLQVSFIKLDFLFFFFRKKKSKI